MTKIRITETLILLIAFVFVVEMIFPGIKEIFWLSGNEIQKKEYWRLFTVALVHGSPLHLIVNLFALYSLGVATENFFGKNKYALILFVSLMFSSAMSAFLNDPYVASIGSSGMIFGLFGSLALIGNRAGVEWRSILVIVGLNLAIGFVLGGVDWRGHLGGLIGGTLATVILRRK